MTPVTRPSSPSQPPRWRQPLALLLVLALLWAQLLGLAHRVWHAPQASAAVAIQETVHGPIQQAPAGLLAHLLGSGQSDPDCRVFDQLAHADSLPTVPALALAALPPIFLAPAPYLRLALAAGAPFAARAPPAAR